MLPDQEKLSTLSVEEVAELLMSQDKLDKKKVDSYVASIEENNINGQVLFTCDLKELKETMNMSFGDWELFRVLILRLREHEMDNLNFGQKNDDKVVTCSSTVPSKQTTASLKVAGSSPPSLKVADSLTTKVSKPPSDVIEPPPASTRTKNSSILEKQVFNIIFN